MVLPAPIRRALGLQAGDDLTAIVEGERVILESRAALLARMQAEFRAASGQRPLVDELIAERRAEAKREE